MSNFKCIFSLKKSPEKLHPAAGTGKEAKQLLGKLAQDDRKSWGRLWGDRAVPIVIAAFQHGSMT